MPAVGTTHHLKLGNEYLMIRPNSYQKSAAPTFGARITSGDPDYNNLSIWQHWVQKCWIGGNGADEWIDDAMFDYSVGIDSTEHEHIRLARDLVRPSATSTLGGATNVAGHKFVIFNNVLYALVMTAGATTSRLYSFSPATLAWTAVTMPAGTFLARTIGTFDGKMFVGGTNAGTKLYYATAPGTWTTVTNPAGVTQTVRCMQSYNGKLYVSYGTDVWRMKDDQTWDGNTIFYKANANSGSNYIVAMETHLGFLYMLSMNGHIHRTDGNNTFDIWSWNGQTRGVSLRSYDGKLFVGTYEWEDVADVGYGVLYQFTGAAVTELKRWGTAGKATVIGNMAVHGRKLFYGAAMEFGRRDGIAVGVYDSVEDAHSVFASQSDIVTYSDVTVTSADDTTLNGVGAGWIVDDVIFHGKYMYASVRGHGVFRVDVASDAITAARATYLPHTNGGFLVSSMYDAGTPGLQKLWRKITVYCDLPALTSFVLEYSIDGGNVWVTPTVSIAPSGGNAQYVFLLNNVRSTRFKWRVTLKTTSNAVTPLLRGVVVAYLPQPEPNWMWSFTIPVADKWLLLDQTQETKSTNTLIAYFEGLYRSQSLVSFTDIDGVVWTPTGPGCLIYDLSVIHYDVEAPNREADLRIRLLEIVETY